jgi:hypothetical protein
MRKTINPVSENHAVAQSERFRRNLALGAFVGLLAGALAVRTASFISESLEYDTYILLVSIHLPYSEYLKGGFHWSIHTHYWWTAHILSSQIWAFRLIPGLLSLLGLFLVSWLVWRARPGDYVAVGFATFFIAVNAHATNLVGYPMISYSVDVLAGGLLVGLLACLVHNRGVTRSVLVFSTLVVPLALFASVMIVVPIVAVSLTYVIWHQFNSSQDEKTAGYRLISSLRKLWPLVLPIAAVLLTTALSSFDNLGPEKRPDMDRFFLQRSGDAGSVAGVAGWSLSSTVRLIGGLALPVSSEQFRLLGLLLGALLAISLFLFVVLGVRAQYRQGFWGALALFIFLNFLGTFLGGVLGLYPFGTIRYWGFMTLPAAIAVGFAFGEFVRSVRPSKIRRLNVGATTAIILSAVVLVVSSTTQTLNAANANKAAIGSLEETADPLIIYSDYSSPALIVYKPWVQDVGLSMGWGTFFGHGSDGGPLSPSIIRFRGKLDSSNRQQITVVAPSREHFDDLYPTWAALLGSSFELAEEISAPSIWIGRYR